MSNTNNEFVAIATNSIASTRLLMNVNNSRLLVIGKQSIEYLHSYFYIIINALSV